MKNKILKMLLSFLMVISTFIGNFTINAATYNLHEEFATDWSYASGKTGQPTLMWVGNYSTWEQAVSANAEVWCVESDLKTQGTSSTLDITVTATELGYNGDQFSDLSLIVYFGERTNIVNEDNKIIDFCLDQFERAESTDLISGSRIKYAIPIKDMIGIESEGELNE